MNIGTCGLCGHRGVLDRDNECLQHEECEKRQADPDDISRLLAHRLCFFSMLLYGSGRRGGRARL